MYELITNGDQTRRAIERLMTCEAAGFDTETTHLNPHNGRMRLLQLAAPDNRAYIWDMDRFRMPALNEDLAPLRHFLSAARPVKVAHNAKFDVQWVRKKLNVEVNSVFDTMLASQIIGCGLPDRHALKYVASRFLNEDVDKTEGISDWSGPLTASQLEYAAKDSEVLLPLRKTMISTLKTNGFIRVAQLEFQAIQPVAELELNGFFLDKDRWRVIIAKTWEKRNEVALRLQEQFATVAPQLTLFGPVDINLDSPQQVSAALSRLGVPDLGTTTEYIMKQLAMRYPVVADLIEYRGLMKSLTSYGENTIDEINPVTGRIHANFRQIGAPTGRFACSNPNIQNVPTPPEYRGCFRPENGNKFVIADYSQIELRILADFSSDPKFIAAFKSGMDFHRATAASVFNVKPEDVTSMQRYFAKRLNFGVVYGIGAQKLALLTDVSEDEAERHLARYFANFDTMDKYLRRCAQDTITTRRAYTGSGRMARYHFDPNDRAAVSHVGRNGRNTPIQGTSADILKRALRLLYNRLKGSHARLVNIIHDEVIYECPEHEAEMVAHAIEEEMVKAAEEYVRAVPIKVDAEIHDDWVKGD